MADLLNWYLIVKELERDYMHQSIASSSIGILGLVQPSILELLENPKEIKKFGKNIYDYVRLRLAERLISDSRSVQFSLTDLQHHYELLTEP